MFMYANLDVCLYAYLVPQNNVISMLLKGVYIYTKSGVQD